MRWGGFLAKQRWFLSGQTGRLALQESLLSCVLSCALPCGTRTPPTSTSEEASSCSMQVKRNASSGMSSRRGEQVRMFCFAKIDWMRVKRHAVFSTLSGQQYFNHSLPSITLHHHFLHTKSTLLSPSDYNKRFHPPCLNPDTRRSLTRSTRSRVMVFLTS